MSARYPAGVVRKNQVVPAANGASGVWTIGQATQAVKSDIWPYNNISMPISQSLRFRQSSTTYLNRTPASAGSSTSFTFSFWTKRGALGYNNVYHSGNSNGNGTLVFGGANTFNTQLFNSVGANYGWASTMVFRDLSAWYHIVVKGFASSSGNSYGGVELALYVNGVQQTFTGSAYNTPSTTNRLTDTTGKQIGGDTTNAEYYDGYLTDFYYIDGQSLDSSSFGSTNAVTGVWQPMPYTGTYGTNGFHLEFKDTTVGKDTSGNNNHWTPNNISTTLGTTYDLMTDVPTQFLPRNTTDVGGVSRGNYCTINPLMQRVSQLPGATPSNGNLTTTHTPPSYGSYVYGSMAVSSGKWYYEMTATTVVGTSLVGIDTGGTQFNSYSGQNTYMQNGSKTINGTTTSYGASWTSGDVIGVAFDLDGGTLTFYKNGTSQGVATSGLSGTYIPHAQGEGGGVYNWNFGQRPFVYTPPSGYKTLCTTNLPTPTIGGTSTTLANKYFDATLYTGNGSTNAITNAGGFQPDFLWIKNRSAVSNWPMHDAIRGAGQQVVSNNTNAEVPGGTELASFNSNGFTVSGTAGSYNASTNAYVAHSWNAGNANTTNTTGSITAIVRANPTSGFSIATFTGNGTAGATVGHGLGVAPSMIMFKGRSTGTSGLVWHTGYGTNQGQMLIDSQAGIYNPGNGLYFNSTYPSSTVVTLGTSGATNGSGITYVLYSWAEIAGFSKFGSYVGNSSSDGPFVYCGFRPKWIMVKKSTTNDSTGAYWQMADTSRNSYNLAENMLSPSVDYAEFTSALQIDILSNGFKLKSSDTYTNKTGETYIFAAYAETPFKNALAR
jgi:hypothetical protein